MDSRYPHLVPIDELPLNFKRRKEIVRFAKRVRDNTGCGACVNRQNAEVYFYLGKVDRGVWSHPMRDLSDNAVAFVCKLIKSARAKPGEKDRILAGRKRDQESEGEQYTGKMFDDRRKDAVSLADAKLSQRVTAGYGTKGIK
jgi:hypothetical protein